MISFIAGSKNELSYLIFISKVPIIHCMNSRSFFILINLLICLCLFWVSSAYSYEFRRGTCLGNALRHLLLVPTAEQIFLGSGKRINRMLLDQGRGLVFAKNYRAAMEILRKNGVSFSWTNQKTGVKRGLVILPMKDGSPLNRQAQAMHDLTGYGIVYSPDFGWSEKIRSIFSSGNVSSEAPVAAADRIRKVIYASPEIVVQGKLTHIERHELTHAFLSNQEDNGIDTGIFFPKLIANAELGVTTGIDSYPRSIDFQELYTFADQIKAMGDAVLKMTPNSRESQQALDEMQIYFDTYSEIILGLNRQALKALDGLNSQGKKIIKFVASSNESPARFEITPFEGLTFRIPAPGRTNESPSFDEMQQVLNANIQRFRKIIDSTFNIHKEIQHFMDSETLAPIDEHGNWSEEFRRLVNFPSEILFEENGASDLSNKLIRFRESF